METETSADQTEVGFSKRTGAIIALLAQSAVLLLSAISSFYVLLDIGPTTVDMICSVQVVKLTFYISSGIVALVLASRIDSGMENINWLRCWVGMCLCYAICFASLALSNPYMVSSFSSLWIVTMNILFSLVPALVILRFTGVTQKLQTPYG